METRKIWCVRAGASGEADDVFMKGDQIAIGVAAIGAEAQQLPPARAAFKEAFARASPHTPATAIPVSAGQLFRFVHEMRIGDYVLYPRKRDRTLHWGEVDGPYVFHADDSGGFAHRRAVRWSGVRSRDVFSPGALYELGSVMALFEVKSFAEEFLNKFLSPARAEEERDDDADGAVARDIEETTKDFIAKRLKTDLKGYAMEPFVADLFRAMGYRSQATRRSRDDGIDVVAHRDELGIEPPILKIQVKSQEANISADCVKAFYAMVHDRDVGIFIATGGYTAAANDFARAKANLKLVDGVAFVDLIQKYYDGLDLKFRRLIPLRHVLAPAIAADR